MHLMAQNVVYLGECSMWVWEEFISCYCWMKSSTDVSYIQLRTLLSLSVSLLKFYLLDLPISDWGAMKSSTIIVGSPVRLQFSQFCLCILTHNSKFKMASFPSLFRSMSSSSNIYCENPIEFMEKKYHKGVGEECDLSLQNL